MSRKDSRNDDSRNPRPGDTRSRTLLIDEDLIPDLVRFFLRYVSRANGSAELGGGSGSAEAVPVPRELFALLGRPAPVEGSASGPVEPTSAKPDDGRDVRPGRRRHEVERGPRARSREVPSRPRSGGSPFSSPEDPAWALWRQAMYLPEDEIEEGARDLVRWLELETSPGEPSPREGRAASGPESGED